MPISKSIPTPSGDQATYWTLVVGTLDLKSGKASGTYQGWKDKATHDAGGMSPEMGMDMSFNADVDVATPLPLPNAGLVPNIVVWADELAVSTIPQFAGGEVVA